MTSETIETAPLEFVCAGCGQRQAGEGRCLRCGAEGVYDLRRPDTRFFLEELELREERRREERLRWVGVAAGIALVIGLWLIPGFGALRRQIMALPLGLDQLILMVAVSYGIILLLERGFRRPTRFPFLKEPFQKQPPEQC
jgi:hypothetical protein